VLAERMRSRAGKQAWQSTSPVDRGGLTTHVSHSHTDNCPHSRHKMQLWIRQR